MARGKEIVEFLNPGDYVRPLFLTNSPHSISVNYDGIFNTLMSFHLSYCPTIHHISLIGSISLLLIGRDVLML